MSQIVTAVLLLTIRAAACPCACGPVITDLLVTAPVGFAARHAPRHPRLGIPYSRPADLTSAPSGEHTASDNNCTSQIRPVSRPPDRPEAPSRTVDSGRKKPN